eukprot:10450568-Alexandrium_andersonii.AAC.1
MTAFRGPCSSSARACGVPGSSHCLSKYCRSEARCGAVAAVAGRRMAEATASGRWLAFLAAVAALREPPSA